jgi:hypothetical protein
VFTGKISIKNKILLAALFFSVPTLADQSRAIRYTGKAIGKIYGKPLEKQAKILIRRCGMNPIYVQNGLIIAGTLASGKAKTKISLGNDYKIEISVSYNEELGHIKLVKSF